MHPLPLLQRWPLPAVAAWAAGWVVMELCVDVGLPDLVAFLMGMLPAAWLSRHAAAGWRRIAVLAGLPLSVLLVQGTHAVPPWAWLLACAALVVIYPIQAWRDAPLFPTPREALVGLPEVAPLASGARVLDAGSGLGDGLMALHRVYPGAKLQGVEGGWGLTWCSRIRLRAAGLRGVRVARGDFWRANWGGYDLVYLFQRPETMPRAWDKALREMRPGSWLVSLEFEVPGVAPARCLDAGGGRTVWIYDISLPATSIPGSAGR